MSAAPTAPLSEAELRVILAPIANDVWPIERMLALCEGWYAGKDTGEIGRAVGCTRNAAIGKTGRLLKANILTPRVSPRYVNRDQSDEGKRLRQRERERHYRKRKADAEYAAAKRLTLTALNRPLASQPKAAERAPWIPPPKFGRTTECCWPIGQPGRPSFHFCDKPTDPGRPYCHTHVGKAYVKVTPLAGAEARA